MRKVPYELDWFLSFLTIKFVRCLIKNSSNSSKVHDALKLKIGRMMVSMVTVSPMLAIISEAGL